ncbi:MAG: hypothetical protein OEX97_03385 [Acidimicrobiia bacterium]|nr:hypothetical protein [Acidimicrobiia bacterium]
MTQDLQVKKQPVPATVFLGDGSTLAGTIFLSPVGPTQPGRETVLELMEEPEAMMPFHAQSERFLLLGKEAIVAIRILSGEAQPELATRVGADVMLRGGFQFNGRVVTGHEDDRLSDVLNHAGEWIRLETVNGVVWLRRSAIIQASQPLT